MLCSESVRALGLGLSLTDVCSWGWVAPHVPSQRPAAAAAAAQAACCAVACSAAASASVHSSSTIDTLHTAQMETAYAVRLAATHWCNLWYRVCTFVSQSLLA
jgi:hypothetical protein